MYICRHGFRALTTASIRYSQDIPIYDKLGVFCIRGAGGFYVRGRGLFRCMNYVLAMKGEWGGGRMERSKP